MQTAYKKTRRQKLLAMAHIAQKELGILDDDYRAILKREFKKNSARDLSEMELGYLIDYFREKGWSPNGQRTMVRQAHHPKQSRRTNHGQQIEKLRERAYEIAAKIENGEARLKGLAKKILGVDSIAWCRDAGKLRRLLAALENIKRIEGEAIWD